MPNISIALVVITVICFVLGAWPISLVTLSVLIIAKIKHPSDDDEKTAFNEPKEKNEQLKAENQRLRQELEQAQAVQRAMEKAEKKGKDD